MGTSGWHYCHWYGPFYLEDLPVSRMLEPYSHHLDTVELNNTFYRLPTENGMATWRTNTPRGFCFAAKGSRFLTHMKKLKDPEIAIGRFFERPDQLRSNLGPIVFQLPLSASTVLGGEWGEAGTLPRCNPTWHSETVYRILRKYNVAFCIFEIRGWRLNVTSRRTLPMCVWTAPEALTRAATLTRISNVGWRA